MKTYISGVDGKPCIWPAPIECIWNGERYRIKDCLQISVPDEFIPEARLFADSVRGLGISRTEFVKEGNTAGIKVHKCSRDNLGSEGYFLEIGETGITLKAGTSCGAFYAFQTLLQLIENSPGLSVCGVKIKDWPVKEKRHIEVKLNKADHPDTIIRFTDFISRYKINGIAIEADKSFSIAEINSLIEYMQQRHIDVKLFKVDYGTGINIYGEVNSRLAGSLEENVYRVLKLSHQLWRTENEPGNISDRLLSEDFEKVALQLYPIECENINKTVYPSSNSRKFQPIELRSFYNAPLYRLSWRPDDYDYMYLTDAPYIPGAAPFSIFQSVNDFKLEPSLVLSGNGRNSGIFSIPVGNCLKSLLFLHSYIAEKSDISAGKDIKAKLKVVGYYNINYRGGETEKIEVIYGKTISFWKRDPASYYTACQATPVFAGKTSYGDSYVIYSQEWINLKPDIPVESVDLLPVEGLQEEGIALFGITAVI